MQQLFGNRRNLRLHFKDGDPLGVVDARFAARPLSSIDILFLLELPVRIVPHTLVCGFGRASFYDVVRAG